MEIGVGVWVKDKKGKESWVPGIVVAKVCVANIALCSIHLLTPFPRMIHK